jgi:hypothetical protein
MKRGLILLIAVLLLVGAGPVLAQIYGGNQRRQNWNPLETVDQARQRHSAERYDIYQEHNNQAPLGGYPERLGDRAPEGTLNPGFTQPKGKFYDPYQNSDPYQDSDRFKW